LYPASVPGLITNLKFFPLLVDNKYEAKFCVCERKVKMKSMDRKAFEEVKKAYIEGIREKIIKYKKLVDKRNLSEIQRLGHSLKGSGTMYGYPEISTFGKKVEIGRR